MPRNVRSVSKAVQDEEQIKSYKKKERHKRMEKTRTWFSFVGLTLVESILCLICLAFAYVYYHKVQTYITDVKTKTKYKKPLVRFILLPPTPVAIAGVFLSVTYLDFISWKFVRPVTYYAWIMVSTAGFLCFCLYSGIILMTNYSITSIVAIVCGLITSLVFLGDLICMLYSMKRFPAPYWVLKRKSDKTDQCVACTGDCATDYEPERPICKCGENWGALCDCDNPLGPDDGTCGCRNDKTCTQQPCECCECATEMLTEEEIEESFEAPHRQSISPSLQLRKSLAPEYSYRQSIALDTRRPSKFSRSRVISERSRSTMVGPDAEEPRKSMANQAVFDFFDESTPVHDYCSQQFPPGMYCIDTQRDQFGAGPSRISDIGSRKYGSRIGTPSEIAVAKSLQSPSHRLSVRPSFRSTSVFSSTRQPSMGARNRSQMSYSAYTTRIDNEELVRNSIAEKQNPVYFYKKEDCKRDFVQSSSEDEEIGNGDLAKRKTTTVVADVIYNSPPEAGEGRKIKPRLRHTASNHPTENTSQTITLPGQTLDSENLRKNLSYSAKEPKRPCSLRPESETRPKSTTRVIRNVSTTVRTLSRVIEADNESRGQQSSSDGVPSGCTITIKKK